MKAIAPLKQLLTPTALEDEEMGRIAGLLNVILLVALVATVVVGVGLLSTTPGAMPGLVAVGTLILVELGALLLTHRGHIQLATWLLSAALGAFLITVTYTFGGVRISSFSSYVVVILIAGLLSGGRAGITFAGLGAAAGLGILYLEFRGDLPPAPMEVTPAFTWITVSASFAVAAALLNLTTRSINDALARVRHSARALAESNHKLEATHALLEKHAVELSQANEKLRHEVTERARVEEQIKASLKEKEALLQEIHHRVKNNLQVISSLLHLQSSQTADKQILGILRESESRVRSMALVHEALYRSPDLARVDFAEYIDHLTTDLFRSYGVNAQDITLKIDVQDVALDIDTAIPCGLIINELVSNALKHAFPDGRKGEVRVDFQADGGDRLVLAVSDDGVGLLEDTDLQLTGTLGLQLVSTLTRQLGGDVELDGSSGTAVRIGFSQPS
jgi:two-component sensor histidine kinase